MSGSGLGMMDNDTNMTTNMTTDMPSDGTMGSMMRPMFTIPTIPDFECLSFRTQPNGDNRCRGFRGSRIAVGCLSMIACIVVLVMIVLLRRYKTFAQRIVLYLFICTAFHSLHYIWSDYKVSMRVLEEALPSGLPPPFGTIEPISDYGRWCRFQGYYAIITSWYIVLWLLCMSMHMLWTGLWEQQSGRFIETISITVNLLVATFIAHVPFLYDAYGPIALYCWIVNRIPGEQMLFDPGPRLQYLLYFIPVGAICIATMIITVVAPLIVHFKLKVIHGPRAEALKEYLRNDIVPLIPYPWLFAASFVFPIVNRIRLSADYRDNEDAHFSFWFLDGVTAASVGFLFAIGFFLNKQIWKAAAQRSPIQGFLNPLGRYGQNGNNYTEEHEMKYQS